MASAVREALREVKQQGGGTHLMGERGFMDTGTPRQALKIRSLGWAVRWADRLSGVSQVSESRRSQRMCGVFSRLLESG